MKENDTELDNLNIPNNTNSNERSSWDSSVSESSNAQTSTLYNHNIESRGENINSKSRSMLSHRNSFGSISTSHTNTQTENNTSTTPNQQAQSPINDPPKPNKTPFLNKITSSLPAFSQMRKTIKASIALLIATIFILNSDTREATGESVLLVAVVVIFYFPVRTIGKNKLKTLV